MLAVAAVSVVVGAAAVTIMTIGEEAPRHVPRGAEVTDSDEVLSGDTTANLRVQIESSLVQSGEPYTQEDVDRQLAEVLELAGGADIISVTFDDGR